MPLSLCSFGRSGLDLVRSDFSLRRAVRLFAGARRRWCAGRLSVSLTSVRWMADDGCCGVMVSTGWDWPDALCWWLYAHGLSWVAWLLFPSVRRGWNQEF